MIVKTYGTGKGIIAQTGGREGRTYKQTHIIFQHVLDEKAKLIQCERTAFSEQWSQTNQISRGVIYTSYSKQ
jgi:hypothetical protein